MILHDERSKHLGRLQTVLDQQTVLAKKHAFGIFGWVDEALLLFKFLATATKLEY